ncbi:unnamed protein product, partial [marine sediment metagenome]
GCPKCKKLNELVEEAINELGVLAEIIKITDINKIIDYGVMVTPALVIDGDVMVVGKISSKEEIIKWIEEKK